MKPLQILLLLQANVLVAATETCRNITIPVNISATNTRLPEDLSPASLSSFLSLGIQSIIELPVTGTYDIAATHCVPSHPTNESNTLHLLLHGSQRDRHYWDGYAFGGEPYHGSNYSWTQRFCNADIRPSRSTGYATGLQLTLILCEFVSSLPKSK